MLTWQSRHVVSRITEPIESWNFHETFAFDILNPFIIITTVALIISTRWSAAVHAYRLILLGADKSIAGSIQNVIDGEVARAWLSCHFKNHLIHWQHPNGSAVASLTNRHRVDAVLFKEGDRILMMGFIDAQKWEEWTEDPVCVNLAHLNVGSHASCFWFLNIWTTI